MANDMKSANGLVLAIITVGITLVMGVFILSNFQTGFYETTSSTVTNETLVNVTALGRTVDGASARDFSAFSILSVINATGGETISSGNYTSSGGTVYSTTSGSYNNTNWKITYTYSYSADTNSSVAAGDVLESLSNGTPWITILVVVGFAVIVLGLLSGLSKSSKGGEGILAAY